MNSKGPIKDYLKYYRVVRHYATKKYGIKQDDLEMLFFFYSEVLFNVTMFSDYERAFTRDKVRLKRMMDDGWIIEQPGIRRVRSRRIYALSRRAKNMVEVLYEFLDGSKILETDPKKNPLFKRTASYRNRKIGEEIVKMNRTLKG
jgi:hypothetical protein